VSGLRKTLRSSQLRRTSDKDKLARIVKTINGSSYPRIRAVAQEYIKCKLPALLRTR
jgi:hypothetical protein